MSGNITVEATLFLRALWTGMQVAFAYNLIQISRRLVKRGTILVNIEDLLFFIAAGIYMFSMIFTYNYGILRGYLIVSIALGAIIYQYGIGRFFVSFVSNVLKKLTKPIKIFIHKYILHYIKKAMKTVISIVKKSIIYIKAKFIKFFKKLLKWLSGITKHFLRKKNKRRYDRKRKPTKKRNQKSRSKKKTKATKTQKQI